jgi:ABC-type polysaccharide/polyol phosphate transport system ATPase subunit
MGVVLSHGKVVTNGPINDAIDAYHAHQFDKFEPEVGF